MQRLVRSEFARFLVTGGIAAGVNVLSRYFLSFAFPYGAAVLIAYACGMTTAWLLARLFVFGDSGRSPTSEYARFALVNAVAALQVYIVSVGLAEYGFPRMGMLWHPEDVAHVIAVTVPVFTSYLGHKHFSFGKAL